MPELPDIAAYITALEARILGQKLEHARLGSVFVLRTADPPLSSAEGRTVVALRRIGKRIAIGVEGDLWLVLHLMIAGRLHWKAPHAKLAGRRSLAAFDFPPVLLCSLKPAPGIAHRCMCSLARKPCVRWTRE